MKPTQAIKTIASCLLMISAWLCSHESNAQRSYSSRYYGAPPFFVALEGGISTTNVNFKSNVADLKDLKFYSQGWNAGLALGIDAIKLRMNVGQYNFKKATTKTIYQNMGSINLNLSPIGLFSRVKYFRAYVIAGVDYSIFSFEGINVPKFINPYLPTSAGTAACCCPTGSVQEPTSEPIAGVMTAEPSTGSDENPTVDPKTLSLKKAQINTGLGFEFTLSKNKRFYKMFAEAHYGIPMKEIINDLSLNKTSLSGQMVVNVGLGFGIAR